MKNRFKILFLLSALVLAVSACSTVDIESQLTDKVVAMSPIPSSVEHRIVGNFSEELRVFYTINGLVPLSQVEVDKAITTAVNKYGGDGASNVRIVDQLSGIDILIQAGLGIGGYLIGALLSSDPTYSAVYGTIGGSVMQFFVQSRTVTVSGDVFRLE